MDTPNIASVGAEPLAGAAAAGGVAGAEAGAVTFGAAGGGAGAGLGGAAGGGDGFWVLGRGNGCGVCADTATLSPITTKIQTNSFTPLL